MSYKLAESQKNNFTHVLLSLLFSFVIISMTYAWSSSSGSSGGFGGGYASGGYSVSASSGRAGYTNVDDRHGNPVGLGYSDYSPGDSGGLGGGGGYGGGGSFDNDWCVPVYQTCYSEANMCGWKNKGKKDIACGGACSAKKPDDPSFTIGGNTLTAGDVCYINDPCNSSKKIQGILSCEGVCIPSGIESICVKSGGDDTNYQFDSTSTYLSLPKSETVNSWLPKSGSIIDGNSRHAYLKAFPNIVKQGKSTSLYLALYNLDYCIVTGDNGDKFEFFGLSDKKVKKTNYQNQEAWLSWFWGGSIKSVSANSKIGSWLSRILGNDTEEGDKELNFKKPDTNLELKSYVYRLGNSNISFVHTSKLNTETKYSIEKCFVVNHKGEVAEYTPSSNSGDLIHATVKVLPIFQEF